MIKGTRLTAVAVAVLFSVAGCKKTADNSLNYKSAINDYYTAHPSCLFSEAQKFPVQVNTSDDSKTKQFDALFNQGLLTRKTAEKEKKFGPIPLGNKQVTDYDLSDKGRSAWTSDTQQPSYGNFCYGHREVDSIDSSTPNSGEAGATTNVVYKWKFSSAPDWAKAAETQNAFSSVATNLSGNGSGSATLVDTNNGWKIQGPVQ